MPNCCTTLLLAAVSLAAAGELLAEGYYDRTSFRSPVTGGQQVVNRHMPHGGMMFDAQSGSLQMTAIGRSPLTGRLEYYNRYMNPWTGAVYETATRFNPFSGRYETQHHFQAPPAGFAAVDGFAPYSEETRSAPPPRRGIKVIEVEQPAEPVLPLESSPSDR